MRGNSEGPSEATRNFAKDIVDEFILDIRGTGNQIRRLDFSWSQFEVSPHRLVRPDESN